mmetsp:Transcript_34020/g.82298  ORF Transcript_34020/g.82298 Transcript_34020/m.82298 type:complete len:477 (+) Transcript_34020:164-1594(+)|eukprot:CAMPEP_0181079566 /NCGR_PEP_ID=MMETSP1071-20121207/2098_1 /TAXON_ID=35127 /ORGANISM="Thalassiosira sp., Strain NH16" /LENGTH=476 /DNA_ID=CAMNT_0023160977 /DNA_START=44 /DNA_END=1474 /DNA_ORIENTATION=-
MIHCNNEQKPRVLSLLSAATEIVCRLGCSHLLVARSHGCDDPPLVTTLPVATAPRVDPNAPSSELDAQVRVQAATGGPIYQIDNALVVAADPTVIITQEQCRICAVTPDDLNRACEDLPPTAKLVTIMPVSLEDVLGDVTTIADSLGVPDRGTRLVAHIRKQLSDLRATSLGVLGGSRPTVAHVEWLAPLMGSGYWIAECVEAAGGKLVHGYAGGHSQTLEKIELLSIADHVIIAPCGFSIERTHHELKKINILGTKEWKDLPAVKNGRVYIADGNRYFNRSSVASILGTAEMVAEMITSDELKGMYGHHGSCWVKLDELSTFCERQGAESVKKDVTLAQGVELLDRARTPGVETENHSPPSDNSITIQHVSNQISALQRGDYHAAFALNSPANKKRLVSAEKFEAIVSGWTSFKMLTLPTTCCEYHADVLGVTTVANVKVNTREEGSHEALSFVFDLTRSGDSERWETDGVRIEC